MRLNGFVKFSGTKVQSTGEGESRVCWRKRWHISTNSENEPELGTELTLGFEGLLDVLRSPNVHQLCEIHRVRRRRRVGARNSNHSPVSVNDFGNSILEDTFGGVRNLEDFGITDEVDGAIEGGESERTSDVGAFEKLGVVAHLTELHDQVHESLDAVVVAQRGGTRNEVGDGDVFAESSVHDPLTRREVTEDIDLDLPSTQTKS